VASTVLQVDVICGRPLIFVFVCPGDAREESELLTWLLYQVSISSTCLLEAFTSSDPKSVKIQWSFFLHFCDSSVGKSDPRWRRTQSRTSTVIFSSRWLASMNSSESFSVSFSLYIMIYRIQSYKSQHIEDYYTFLIYIKSRWMWG